MKKEKILLALLPFWAPLIPPAGIACLKGHLKGFGYTVQTVDVNVEVKSREFYENYFNTLETYIPANKTKTGTPIRRFLSRV